MHDRVEPGLVLVGEVARAHCSPASAAALWCSGFFFIDDEVLRAAGVVDLSPYRVDPACAESDLMPDFFV